MPKVLSIYGVNTLMVISAEEMKKLIRVLVDNRGFQDRAIKSVQINVNKPFEEGTICHDEVPSLTISISNSTSSRKWNE